MSRNLQRDLDELKRTCHSIQNELKQQKQCTDELSRKLNELVAFNSMRSQQHETYVKQRNTLLQQNVAIKYSSELGNDLIKEIREFYRPLMMSKNEHSAEKSHMEHIRKCVNENSLFLKSSKRNVQKITDNKIPEFYTTIKRLADKIDIKKEQFRLEHEEKLRKIQQAKDKKMEIARKVTFAINEFEERDALKKQLVSKQWDLKEKQKVFNEVQGTLKMISSKENLESRISQKRNDLSITANKIKQIKIKSQKYDCLKMKSENQIINSLKGGLVNTLGLLNKIKQKRDTFRTTFIHHEENLRKIEQTIEGLKIKLKDYESFDPTFTETLSRTLIQKEETLKKIEEQMKETGSHLTSQLGSFQKELEELRSRLSTAETNTEKERRNHQVEMKALQQQFEEQLTTDTTTLDSAVKMLKNAEKQMELTQSEIKILTESLKGRQLSQMSSGSIRRTSTQKKPPESSGPDDDVESFVSYTQLSYDASPKRAKF